MKEDFAGAEAEGLVTFKASYEAQTKTVLNGLTPYWTASEKIAIFNGVNNEFTATVTEPSATATFKGELAGKGTKNFRAGRLYIFFTRFYILRTFNPTGTDCCGEQLRSAGACCHRSV